MLTKIIQVVIFCLLFSFSTTVPTDEETKAGEFIKNLEDEFSGVCSNAAEKAWDHYTNITDATEKAMIDAQGKFSKYTKKLQQMVLKDFGNWKLYEDPKLRRQYKYLAISGQGNMSDEDVEKMTKLSTEMEGFYSKAKVCDYKDRQKCDLSLDPDITNILQTSEDSDELAYYWNAWHDATSKTLTGEVYKKNINYIKMYANANGIKSPTDMWILGYDAETPDWTPQKFIEQLKNLWKDKIKPQYDILYAYVRMKLRANSPFKDQIEKCGKIPIHITGNMWGQTWTKLEKWTKPFPNATSSDITSLMKKKNYTVEKIFRESDKFFQGLGLLKMTDTFWNKSMFVRPKGREVACHATAHDLCKGKGSTDFRIKMCTEVTMKDLLVVHHEMGHIQYYQQYTDLPITYRTGANPGFHEAIGDTLALAVVTPKHLQCVLELPLGLNVDCGSKQKNDKPPSVTETDINALYVNALEKLAFPAFAMSVDAWRFEAFDGKIEPKDYNKRWWEIREEFQGLSLPNKRGDDKFDPGAKYHIPSNTEYVRYFFSSLAMYSFYEALCKAAGEFDPNNPNSKQLYQCDFSESKEAGKLFEKLLKAGFKDPWPETLKKITGDSELCHLSLLRYYEPLFNRLEEELKENGEDECLKKPLG